MPAPLLRGRLAVNRGSIAINAKALNNPGIRPKKRQSIVNPAGIALNLKGDRDLFAFSTPFGIYVPTRMIMGDPNAPGKFLE